MRREEITALRWRSIDLDAGQLAVVASTEQIKAGCREKDAKSGRCRTLALPAILVTELRRHRIAQAQAMLSIGVRVTTDHHVVMQADATPLQPNSITHAVTLFMKKRGSKVRLHGMRHSHATHMLVANVHDGGDIFDARRRARSGAPHLPAPAERPRPRPHPPLGSRETPP